MGEPSVSWKNHNFVRRDKSWYCEWCDKPMREGDHGYCAPDGLCYCSKRCAQEKDWNR